MQSISGLISHIGHLLTPGRECLVRIETFDGTHPQTTIEHRALFFSEIEKSVTILARTVYGKVIRLIFHLKFEGRNPEVHIFPWTFGIVLLTFSLYVVNTRTWMSKTTMTKPKLIQLWYTVRAPVFGRHQFFGTSEHYRKAHGSLLSGWMNYNYTACCRLPTSSNILKLPSQFWKPGLKVTDCTVQSAEYWCSYGTVPNAYSIQVLAGLLGSRYQLFKINKMLKDFDK